MFGRFYICNSGDIKKRKSPQKRAFGDSYRIQTCNLLIRSQMLYSVELRSLPNHFRFAIAKLQLFYELTKYSGHFFCVFSFSQESVRSVFI